jgi:hypothetical protein
MFKSRQLDAPDEERCRGGEFVRVEPETIYSLQCRLEPAYVEPC